MKANPDVAECGLLMWPIAYCGWTSRQTRWRYWMKPWREFSRGQWKITFRDVNDNLNWVFNRRAHALVSSIGSRGCDHAICQERPHLSENGTPMSVKQSIWRDAYYLLGTAAHRDARRTLAEFQADNVEPLRVRWQFEEARACAYAQFNDRRTFDQVDGLYRCTYGGRSRCQTGRLDLCRRSRWRRK